MILSKIIVTSFGLILIGFIYWFFFGKKSSTAEVLDGQGEIKVTVEGGYKPEVIKLKNRHQSVSGRFYNPRSEN